MYIWKCWRDNRNRFVILLLVIGALIVLGTKGSWRVDSSSSVPVSQFRFAWAIVLAGSHVLVPFLALGLGPSGVGSELSSKTAEFLFTRPRHRRYFVWVSWATGIAQTLLIIAAYMLLALVLLLYRKRAPFTWELLVSILPFLILGALTYSMTYLLTALLRSSRNGFFAGTAAVLLFPMLVNWMHTQWSISLPTPSDLFPHSLDGVSVAFPIGATLVWILFTIACPFVAEWYIERLDV